MSIADENVLVFPRAILEEFGVFQGFSSDVARYLPPILDRTKNSFRPRAQVETNPSYKQIIPYVVITDGANILHYVRGKKAGEQRLVAKGSIGIGGHINDEDHSLFVTDLQAFQDAVAREVHEELTIEGSFDAKPVGLINDDSTDVGSVHFGIVHVMFRERHQVRKKEQVITQVEFLPIKDLLARRDQMETWSQLCLDNLAALLKR